MASTIHLDIVSAEHELFSGTCTMVAAPAEGGEVGIMPGHAPMITRLKARRGVGANRRWRRAILLHQRRYFGSPTARRHRSV